MPGTVLSALPVISFTAHNKNHSHFTDNETEVQSDLPGSNQVGPNLLTICSVCTLQNVDQSPSFGDSCPHGLLSLDPSPHLLVLLSSHPSFLPPTGYTEF